MPHIRGAKIIAYAVSYWLIGDALSVSLSIDSNIAGNAFGSRAGADSLSPLTIRHFASGVEKQSTVLSVCNDCQSIRLGTYVHI